MASEDRLALDVTALRIAGVKISEIKYLSIAAERRLGMYKPSEIKIKGLDTKNLSHKWLMRSIR